MNMGTKNKPKLVLLHKHRVSEAAVCGEASVGICADCDAAFSGKKPVCGHIVCCVLEELLGYYHWDRDTATKSLFVVISFVVLWKSFWAIKTGTAIRPQKACLWSYRLLCFGRAFGL